jgi:hypothetical protein
MLVLLAVLLQAIETRLLGNGPVRAGSTEQADVVIPPGPTVSSTSSARRADTRSVALAPAEESGAGLLEHPAGVVPGVRLRRLHDESDRR